MIKKKEYIKELISILRFLKKEKEENIRTLTTLNKYLIDDIIDRIYNKEIEHAKQEAINHNQSKARAVPKVEDARLVRYCRKVEELDKVFEFEGTNVSEKPLGYNLCINMKLNIDDDLIYSDSSREELKKALYDKDVIRESCGKDISNIKIKLGKTKFNVGEYEKKLEKPVLFFNYLLPISLEKMAQINKKKKNKKFSKESLREAIGTTPRRILEEMFEFEIGGIIKTTVDYMLQNYK